MISRFMVLDFLFNRKRLIKNGGFYNLPLAWSSDDISAYIAAKDTGIANMQVPGFQYRVNSLTISNTGNVAYKMRAIDEEVDWYRSFLFKDNTNLNINDKVFKQMLLQKLENFCNRKKVSTISSDLATNGLHKILFYFKNLTKFNLSSQIILYSFVEAIRLYVVKK